MSSRSFPERPGAGVPIRVVFAAILLLAPATLSAAAPPRVLVIDSLNHLIHASRVMNGAIRSELARDPDARVEVFTEFMDSANFSGPGHEANFGSYLEEKYRDDPPAVLIVLGQPALRFVLARRDTLFPAASIVVLATDSPTLRAIGPRQELSAVPLDVSFAPTVNVALEAHPAVKRIVLVHGTSGVETAWGRQALSELERLDTGRAIEVLDTLSVEEIERRVARLGHDSVVLYLGLLRDGAGRSIDVDEGARRVAAASSVPVYGAFETFIGTGVVGGVVVSFDRHAREGAALARRLLKGERVARIGAPTPLEFIADARQLKRWGIAERSLPAGSSVRFRTPSAWELYRTEIVIAIVVMAVQAILIVVLLAERRRRRHAEQLQRQGAARLRLIADSLPALIAYVDRDQRYVFNNESYAAWFGVTPDEARGRTVREVLGEESYAMARAHVERVLSGERVQFSATASFGNGMSRDVEAIFVPDVDASGSVLGYCSLVVDVTQEKRVERQTRELQYELAHASRVSLLGQLSAALAHELNQPLTAIMTNAQAAQRFIARDPSDLTEIGEILNDIVRDDERAAGVISRMRAFLKKGEAEAELLDVNELVSDVVLLARGDIDRKRLTIRQAMGDGLPSVRGDRIQLQQVILNLLTNAADAAASASPEHREITVATTRSEDGSVVIAVSDQGTGISAMAMDRLFEPFRTTKREGMGLGLAISRSIVESHGGRIEAANNRDRGAEFRVTLPPAEEVG